MTDAARTPPDGIRPEHERNSRRANPWPLVALSLLMATGLTGALGGQPADLLHAAGDGVEMRVRTPETLRNGMIFETTVEVRPHRPIGELVIAVSDGLWRDMTVNTMIPAAAEERSEKGYHLFSFGPAKTGDLFRFKIDGQINPPLFAGTSGDIAVLDGERRLAGVPVAVTVLP